MQDKKHMEVDDSSVFKGYAGFWVRFIAYLIDSIVLFIVQSIINLLFGFPIFSDTQNIENLGMSATSIIINLSISALYFALFESSSHMATIGKMALDLKVVKEDGTQLSFLNALGRYFGKIISAVILLIGFIMAAFDSKKQALHDKLAKTLVIHT